MCGDIMYLCNAKYATGYLNLSISILHAVLKNALKKQESLLSKNIKLVRKEFNVLNDGIKVQQEQQLKNDIDQNQKQKLWLLKGFIDIKKEILKNVKRGIENMGIGAEDIMQVFLIEMQSLKNSIQWEMPALIVDLQKKLKLIILSHYQKVEKIISIIYSHFVNLVIPPKEIAHEY